MSVDASQQHDTLTAESGWRREYRYSSRLRAAAVLWAALGIVCAGLVAGLAVWMLRSNDLSYLTAWPLWFRFLFWITNSLFAAAVAIIVPGYQVGYLARVWPHLRDSVVLDQDGVTLRQGRTAVSFRYEEVTAVTRQLFDVGVRARGMMHRIPKGLADSAEMFAEIEARIPGGRNLAERLAGGEPMHPARLRSFYPVLVVCGGQALAIPWLYLLSHVHLPGASQPMLLRGPTALEAVGLTVAPLALCAWVLLPAYMAGIQLLAGEMRYRDWHGRILAVPYTHLLSVQWRPRSRWRAHDELHLTYADAAAPRGERPLTLSTGLSWRTGLLTAVRHELIARAGLVASVRKANLWVRPTSRT